MEEYKFRGKRVDRGKTISTREWVYGYLICMSYRVWIKDTSDQHTNPRRLDGINHTADIRCVEVDPGTVGQYTSRLDCNKKEVYKGDIVHCYGIGNNADEEYNAEVVFCEENAAFMLDAGCELFSFSEMSELCEIEVIGNIYENSKLLEATP